MQSILTTQKQTNTLTNTSEDLHSNSYTSQVMSMVAKHHRQSFLL